LIEWHIGSILFAKLQSTEKYETCILENKAAIYIMLKIIHHVTIMTFL